MASLDGQVYAKVGGVASAKVTVHAEASLTPRYTTQAVGEEGIGPIRRPRLPGVPIYSTQACGEEVFSGC